MSCRAECRVDTQGLSPAHLEAHCSAEVLDLALLPPPHRLGLWRQLRTGGQRGQHSTHWAVRAGTPAGGASAASCGGSGGRPMPAAPLPPPPTPPHLGQRPHDVVPHNLPQRRGGVEECGGHKHAPRRQHPADLGKRGLRGPGKRGGHGAEVGAQRRRVMRNRPSLPSRQGVLAGQEEKGPCSPWLATLPGCGQVLTAGLGQQCSAAPACMPATEPVANGRRATSARTRM